MPLLKHLPARARLRAHPAIVALRRAGLRINHPALWSRSRTAIARAAAVGLFCAYLPMPFEMLPAAALAVLWRANLPLAVALVWLSNPLTWIPLYAPAYLLGAAILDAPGADITHLTIGAMMQELGALWLGCLIFGVVFAGLGFAAVHLIWRYLVLKIVQRRKARRAGRKQKEIQ